MKLTLLKKYAFNEYHKTFDICCLAGNRNRDIRREILVELTGEKLPYSKCGVKAIETIIFDYVKPNGTCLANSNNIIYSEIMNDNR